MKGQASALLWAGVRLGGCTRDGLAGQHYLWLAMGWLRWAQKSATSSSLVPVLQSVQRRQLLR